MGEEVKRNLESKTKSHTGPVIAIIVVVVLFYMASPVICFLIWGNATVPRFIEMLFRPLVWLYGNWYPYRAFIDAFS